MGSGRPAPIGDDIVVYEDDSRRTELTRLPMLRQQEVHRGSAVRTDRSPTSSPRERPACPTTSACLPSPQGSAPTIWRGFEADHDDYNAIMVKALADRLAEAFAEYVHAKARQDWGYGENERLSNEDLVAEKYRGIRPAYGYPACPDHTEKLKLFDLLDAERQGLTLTDSFAMLPAACVSGLYFSHPQAKYFNVGRIGRDQIGVLRRAEGRVA